MTTTPPAPAAAATRVTARGEIVRAALTVLLSLAILVPILLLDRPPATPQLTFIGGGDSLSLLLEGAGGGRVLLGGGGAPADLPAALGRRWWPWNGRLDLLIIADRRDLPGATELVRRGGVRAVSTVGLDNDRSAAAALAALRDTCAARSVPLRAVEDAERIAIGRGGALALDVLPAPMPGDLPSFRLNAGQFTAVIPGSAGVASPALAAILLHGGQEAHRAALAADARLIVAPAPVPTSVGGAPTGTYSILVASGERAALAIEADRLRLRGGVAIPLDGAPPPR